ncbi:fibronectin type III domain-containing protein [Desulfogranum japonicum]|uniref:fibronectin type III domain-containing protein n=1 Tax=Desulfogranum japonicum TaxID=231447 RepID=UPI00049129C9|nr:hypothetical protein [Desulfogranum japonicum]
MLIISHSIQTRVLFIFLYICFFMPALCFSSPASPETKTDIQVQTYPQTKTTLLQHVAILPFSSSKKDIDKLTTFFWEKLNHAGLYELIPLEHVKSVLEEHHIQHAQGKQSHEYLLQVGKSLRTRGILSATLTHLPESILTTALPGKQSLLTINLLDIQTDQVIWDIHITFTHYSGNAYPSDASLVTALDDALKQLIEALIYQGAIFSSRIPAPKIISVRGLIRKARIVVQPAPPFIHTGYQLFRAKAATDMFTPVGSIIANNTTPIVLEDTDLEDDSTYFYTISAYNKEGLASIPQQPFSITTIGKPKPISTILATGNGLRRILLSWEPSPDPNVTGYTIYRAGSKEGPFERIAEIDDRDRQSYVDRGSARSYERYGKLADNTTYYYTIRSQNNVGVESEDSDVVFATTKGAPPPPQHLKAISNQPRKVSLSWAGSSDPHTREYMVFRAMDEAGPFEQIANIDGRHQLQYVDEGGYLDPLQDNTTYFYTLQAVNVVGTASENSKAVSATTKPAPAMVEGITCSQSSLKKVELQWSGNRAPDIRRYEIFRGTLPDTVTLKVGDVSAERQSFTDISLADGQRYWYGIRAIDYDKLKGPISNPVSCSTKPPPTAPSGLTGNITDKGLTLTWDANTELDIAYYSVISVGFLNREIQKTQKTGVTLELDLEPDREYNFQVKAVDKDGLVSEASEPVTIQYHPKEHKLPMESETEPQAP